MKELSPGDFNRHAKRLRRAFESRKASVAEGVLTPARDRPINVLRRQIYKYARELIDAGLTNDLATYLRNAGCDLRIGDCPFSLVMLLVVSGDEEPITKGNRSKYRVEFAFAHEHDIDWLMFDVFVSAMGGSALINKRRTTRDVGGTLDWAGGLKRSAQEAYRQQNPLPRVTEAN